jgi:hypothetical protein
MNSLECINACAKQLNTTSRLIRGQSASAIETYLRAL